MSSKATSPANQKAPARVGASTESLAADPIDLEYLSRFTAGNRALEREVLELFAGQMPLYLEELRAAQTSKSWRDAAHTIKGSAAAVGAWRLARIAEMAETLDVEAGVANIEGHRARAMSALVEAVEEVCGYVERLFPAP